MIEPDNKLIPVWRRLGENDPKPANGQWIQVATPGIYAFEFDIVRVPDYGQHTDKGEGSTHYKGDDCEPKVSNPPPLEVEPDNKPVIALGRAMRMIAVDDMVYNVDLIPEAFPSNDGSKSAKSDDAILEPDTAIEEREYLALVCSPLGKTITDAAQPFGLDESSQFSDALPHIISAIREMITEAENQAYEDGLEKALTPLFGEDWPMSLTINDVVFSQPHLLIITKLVNAKIAERLQEIKERNKQ